MRLRSRADAGGPPAAVRPAPTRRPAFLIRLTPIGGLYLVLCLLAAGAAANTGNNGMFMVAALFLGTLAASGFVSRRNVWQLSVGVEPAGEIFAGEEALVGFRLRVDGRGRGRAIRFDVEWPDGDAPPALVGEIPGGASLRIDVAHRFEARGRQPAGAVFVSSLFPFGLFRKGRRLRTNDELLVYPRVVPIPLDTMLRAAAGAGDESTRMRGRSGEPDGMRDFRPGDDPRDIHWKQSARHRRLILKERLAEGAGWTTIVLDPGAVPAERFEALVSASASLAVALLDAGRSVALRSRELLIPPAAGREQRRRILDALALVPAESTSPPLAFDPPAAGEVRIRAEEIPC